MYNLQREIYTVLRKGLYGRSGMSLSCCIDKWTTFAVAGSFLRPLLCVVARECNREGILVVVELWKVCGANVSLVLLL
jgi:hypothetical protein